MKRVAYLLVSALLFSGCGVPLAPAPSVTPLPPSATASQIPSVTASSVSPSPLPPTPTVTEPPAPTPVFTPDATGEALIAPYRGLKVPPYPQGTHEQGGWSVDPEGGLGNEYAIAIVQIGSWNTLWFDEMTFRDTAGHAHWKNLDILPLGKGEYPIDGCYSKDTSFWDIVALGHTGSSAEEVVIERAWRADVTSGKFLPIDPSQAVCIGYAGGE
jgi:hypothetical protein